MNIPMQAYRSLPFWNVLLKRLGAERDFRKAAVEVEVCQPEEVEDIPPPVSLPGQLELIKGVTKHDTLAKQISAAQKTTLHHAPLIRYVLKDCVVADHGVEFLAGSSRKHSLRRTHLLTPRLTEEASALYSMSPVSHAYFGHFLTDACSTALLAENDQALLLDIDPAWPHAAGYAEAFRLAPAPSVPMLVRRLTVFQDHGQGSHKRERYRELRKRVAERFGPPGKACETVFLRRGATGAARLIADEDRLVDTLAAQGVRIVSLKGMDLGTLADELRHAQTVITIEGSHVTHAYYLAPSGMNLCILMPEDHATFIHNGLAHAFGGRFGYVICQRQGKYYQIEASSILKTIDFFDK